MDWIDIAAKFGIPTAILLLVLFGIWRVVVWSAENIAKPVVDAHKEYLAKTALTSERAAKAIEKLQASNEDQAKCLANIEETNIKASNCLYEIVRSMPGMCKAKGE